MITNPDIYLGDNYVVLDFETTNLEKGSPLESGNTLLLACWSVGHAHVAFGWDVCSYSHWADEYGQHLLSEHIAQAAFIVAHGSKFELGWLARCGVDLRKILGWDTLLAEKVIAGNLKTSLSLDATATRRGLGQKDSTAATLIKAGVCPSNIPTSILEKYCVQDVALTTKIFHQQREELQALGLMPVFLARNLVTPVLADIETPGMGLDKDRVEAVYGDYKERYDALMEEFSRLTGGINLKSPKQMRELLYVKLGFEEVEDYKGNAIKTDTGESSTGKDIIAQLKAVTPEQKELKKCAVALSLLKTPMQNLTKMLKKAQAGERMYASFNQAVTQTHRLSSSARRGGMQFQNFDRAFKPCFVARRPGYVILEADYAQLEFRVAGDITRDSRVRSAVLLGEDVHELASTTLGITRQNAKAKTFRPLYGGSAGTPKEKKYYKAFREKYKTVYDTQTKWTHEVVKTKQLRIPSGLLFYWPDTVVKPSGYISNSTNIFNYPIQSFSSEVVLLACRSIWEKIEGLDARILNTVHDSIILEVSLEVLDGVMEIVLHSMTEEIYTILHSLYDYKFEIPLGIEMKWSTHWADKDSKTIKHEAQI